MKSLSLYLGARLGLSRKSSPAVAFLTRISILSLVLGVALLVLVSSVMNGFDRELRERILGIVPHGELRASMPLNDWPDLITAVEEHASVVGAAPFIKLQGLLVKGSQSMPIEASAVVARYERKVSIINRYMQQGTLQALDEQDNAVVISQVMASELKLKLGDSVALLLPGENQSLMQPRLKRLTVAGIYATHTELDHAKIYVPLAIAQQLLDYGNGVQGVELKVVDLLRVREIVYDLMISLPYPVYGNDWTSSHGNLFQAVQLSKRLVVLMLFVIVAVAAFNIVTALTMVVADKRSDIAIWQTMGMGQWAILKIFVVQGMAIGSAGVLLGVLLGIGLASVATPTVQWVEQLIGYQFLQSSIYPVSSLPVDIRAGDVGNIAGVSLLFAFISTLFPAWRASRVLPAEALRYEV